MDNRHKMLISPTWSKEFDPERARASADLVAERRAAGLAHLAAADRGAAAMLARAAVPDVCGSDIAAAPARGGFRVFRPVEIIPGSSGTARPAGYRAPGEATFRCAIIGADVFDAMEAAALRAHLGRHGDEAGFASLFTPGQAAMARDYRQLVERRAAGGIKCASLEAGRGGVSGGEFIDAFVADGLRLAAIERRIGAGVALSVRRIRPSARGKQARGIITDRVLVDSVCLVGKTVTAVLRAHGWAKSSAHIDALRQALAAALDRMQGYEVRQYTK